MIYNRMEDDGGWVVIVKEQRWLSENANETERREREKGKEKERRRKN